MTILINLNEFVLIPLLHLNLSLPMKKIVFELSYDNSLKIKFDSIELTKCWISIKIKYPLISNKSQCILIPLFTSYLCSTGFSAVTMIKIKYQIKINIEKEIRIAMSSLILRFKNMCSYIQAHLSH